MVFAHHEIFFILPGRFLSITTECRCSIDIRLGKSPRVSRKTPFFSSFTHVVVRNRVIYYQIAYCHLSRANPLIEPLIAYRTAPRPVAFNTNQLRTPFFTSSHRTAWFFIRSVNLIALGLSWWRWRVLCWTFFPDNRPLYGSVGQYYVAAPGRSWRGVPDIGTNHLLRHANLFERLNLIPFHQTELVANFLI